MRPHTKIPGFVTQIQGSRWWARLDVDGREYEAEMVMPLADDAVEGQYFTVHFPKGGDPYVYWIRQPVWTKRRLKKVRQRARALRKALFEGDR